MIKLSYWFQEGCEYRSDQETKGAVCVLFLQCTRCDFILPLTTTCFMYRQVFPVCMSYPYSYIMMATKFLSQAVKMQMCWCAFVHCVSSDYKQYEYENSPTFCSCILPSQHVPIYLLHVLLCTVVLSDTVSLFASVCQTTSFTYILYLSLISPEHLKTCW